MMRMKTTTSTPVFPSSWFRIAQSQALPPGGVKPLHYFDRDFVLFRTHEGSIHLLDAFCPHLGAHLGHGGTVHRESIRCPYHSMLAGRLIASQGSVSTTYYGPGYDVSYYSNPRSFVY